MEMTKHDKFLKGLNVEAILDQDQEADIPRDLPMRKWLYSWLLDPNIPGNFQAAIDKWISYLIIGNLFSLMFEHLPAVYEPYRTWFELFDIFLVAVFTVDLDRRARTILGTVCTGFLGNLFYHQRFLALYLKAFDLMQRPLNGAFFMQGKHHECERMNA